MPKRKPVRHFSQPALRKPSRAVSADGLENLVTGMGTRQSKLTHSRFVYSNTLFDWGELEAAYRDNWLASAIVDIPADDMTREWRAIKCKDADAIRAEEDRVKLQSATNLANRWSRLYGGAAVLMLTNQDFEKPLDVNKIGQGDLSRLVVVDRRHMFAGEINTWDILSESFMLPEYWNLFNSKDGQRIHHSHFAFFRGKELPTILKQQAQGWGDSELRRCMQELKEMLSSKTGIAELMQQANLDVVKRTGLSEELTTGQESAIQDRYALFNMMKSVFNLALLSDEEDLTRMTLNFGGIAPTLDVLKSFVVGCSGIPATRLFGEQAKGLGNEGAGDLNNYYDNIRAKQNTYLDPAMRPLDEVMVRSAVGTMPSDYNYDWNRLYQPNRKEEAEARKIEAETATLYLDAGVIQKSQVMRNLESDEQYHYPEGVIDALEEAEKSNWEPENLEEAAKAFEEEQRAANNELGREVV